MNIKHGYCRCGCNEKTSIATRNRTSVNMVKGQPLKYIVGHNVKRKRSVKIIISSEGRLLIYKPDHVHSWKNGGYVYNSVLVASDVLGRKLPQSAIVHHVNGNKMDDRNNNLVICEDPAYHNFLHQRTRALKESGNANFRKCTFVVNMIILKICILKVVIVIIRNVERYIIKNGNKGQEGAWW